MGYIDAHTHIVFKETITEELLNFALREWGAPRETVLMGVKDVVKILDDANIDYVGIMAFPSRKLGIAKEDYAIRVINAVRDYADRFAIIGGVEANELSIEDTRHWLERQYEAGISAIKVHPPHMWLKPNAYRPEEGGLRQLEIIYQFAVDHGLPVYIHTGTSAFSRARNKYGDPIFVDDVAVDFPRLTILVSHVGRPNWIATAFQLIRIRPNILADLSSIPPKRILDYIPRLSEISDKSIYGSDYPGPGVHDIKANLQEFLNISMSKEVIKKIVDDNPRRVLKPLSRNR
ncbi:amidohydrolase 2 [Vulcanisaeta moutnovskia 768-28]|uniref:Amidohydrolase 2 n=1 Tax=Vulcanisaeta moutnovskia (strain 768-28) TaxID=985053 RepID=F0QU96_VULM7|nr:amidohydrolase family protein [Vulcanisaeta moutnovskia]ADY00636.1 amidohydrolase 2 [Vulcanisaeta moutnovskia 768-28]